MIPKALGDLLRLRWLIHRWPSVDEPSVTRRRAALDALCGGGSSAGVRVLVVVSHADDEVAWAASSLCQLHDRVTLVYVTDGAPRNRLSLRDSGFPSAAAYAAARRLERDRALALMNIASGQVHELNYVDQQAKCNLVALTERLDALIEATKPNIVLTHAYEGGHVDHDATAYAVHHAVRSRRDSGRVTPVIIEFAGYHRRFGRQRTFRFLPAHHCETRTVVLTPAMRRLKQQLFDCYSSQASALRYYPIAVERFRCAPRYDFRESANWERVLYADQAIDGEPHRTLSRAMIDEADDALRAR